MAEIIPGDGIQSTLTAAITAAATTLTIQSADYPSWPSAGTYRCVLFSDPNNGPWEIVTVTGGQGTATLTVTRASEAYRGTQVAQAWAAGTSIVPVLTTGGLSTLLAAGGGGSKLLLNYVEPSDIANNVTLTANTWTNVGSAKNFSVDDPSALVRIEVGGYMLVGAAGSASNNAVSVLIDGANRYVISGDRGSATEFSNPLAGSTPVEISGLSVGAHTMQVQVISDGASRWYLVPGTNAGGSVPNTSLTIRILQVPTPQTRNATPPAVLGSKVLLDWAATVDIWNSQAITAATWTDIPTTSQQFTVDDPTANIEADVWGSVQVSSSNTGSHVTRLVLDGTIYKPLGSIPVNGGDYGNALSGASLVSLGALSAGVHTVKVQLYCSPAASVSDMRPVAQSPQHAFGIRVFERAATVTGPLSPGGSAGDKLLLNWAASTDLANGLAISTNTWTDAPGTSQSFTVDDSTALIEVDVGGSVRVGANASAGDEATRLVLDGGPTFPLGYVTSAAGNFNNALAGASPVSLGQLTTGSHSVKVQIQSNNASPVLYLRAATNPVFENLAIRVWQRPTVYRGGSVPAASVRSSTYPSIANNTGTVLTFDAVTYDTDSMASQTDRLIVRTPGKYLITAGGRWADNPSGLREVSVYKNGVSGAPVADDVRTATGANAVSLSVVSDCQAGDYFQINAYQSSGGSLAFGQTGYEYPYLQATRMGDTLAPQYPTPGAKILLDYAETADHYNNAATTANTWYDLLTGTAVTFNVDDPTAIVEVAISGNIYLGYSGAPGIESQVLIDSTAYRVGGAKVDTAMWQNPFNGANAIPIRGLSVGPHTLRVQVMSGANSTMYAQFASFADHFLRVRVKQQPQQSASYGVAAKLLLDWTVPNTADITTGSGFNSPQSAWTDVPGTSLSFQVDDPNAIVEVSYFGTYGATPTNSAARMVSSTRVVVDGTRTRVIAGASETGNQSPLMNILQGAQPVAFSGLGVGTHTVKLQLWCQEQALTLYSQPLSDPNRDSFSCQVQQISQGAQPPAPQYGFEFVVNQAQPTVTLPVSGQLPQGFHHIRIRYKARADAQQAASYDSLFLQFNGDTTVGDYEWERVSGAGGASSASGNSSASNMQVGYAAGSGAPAGDSSVGIIEIPSYSDTSFRKGILAQSELSVSGNGGSSGEVDAWSGQWHSTAAITSLTFSLSTGNFVAGSVFTLELIGPPVSPPGIPGPGAGPVKGPEAALISPAASVTLPVSGQLLQNYRHVRIIVQARSDAAATEAGLQIQFNGDTAANYQDQEHVGFGTTSSAGQDIGRTSILLNDGITASTAPAGAAGNVVILIPNYAGTTFRKGVKANSGLSKADSAGNLVTAEYFGEWRNTAAITSITLSPSAGNFVTGSLFTLYYEP